MEDNRTLSKTYPTYRSLGRPIFFMGFTGAQLLILFGITVGLWLIVSPWLISLPLICYFIIGRPSNKAAKNGNYRYLSGLILSFLMPSAAEDKEGFLKDL